MRRFYKGVLRLLKAYASNVFDGKITTLVGVILIGLGIYRATHGAEYLEVLAYVGGGLGIAGFKDPSSTKPPEP